MTKRMRAAMGRACVASVMVLMMATVMTMSGCAGSTRPDPTPLAPLMPQLAVKVAWKRSLGGAVNFPLSVATQGNVVVLANDAGDVLAVQADTGAELWRFAVGSPLSAGVGSDGRMAAVVTRDNELVVLDQGKLAWRAPLGTRVSTAPLVAGERVFVLTQDRGLRAFDAFDGRYLWSTQRPGDALTLSAAGVLLAYRDTLLAGQGARLAGVDPLQGSVRWEATVASPRGTNEVERLADLVGPAARKGEVVCARSFQAAVACIDVDRGTTLWTRNASGVSGLGLRDGLLVGADASDRITAWRVVDGSVAATFEDWLYRGLSPFLATPRGFVAGDAEGWVHWLAPQATAELARMPTDGSAVRVQPVNVGGTILVVTRDGGLFAYKAE